jgi:hypothetical protein
MTLSPVPREAWPQLIEQVRAGQQMVQFGGSWLVSGRSAATWLHRHVGIPRRLIVQIETLPPGVDPLARLGCL